MNVALSVHNVTRIRVREAEMLSPQTGLPFAVQRFELWTEDGAMHLISCIGHKSEPISLQDDSRG